MNMESIQKIMGIQQGVFLQACFLHCLGHSIIWHISKQNPKKLSKI